MSKRISIEYYGMPGSGATVKEAREEAGRKIREALGKIYEPIVIHWRKQVCVIMANKWGYGYRFYGEIDLAIVQHTDMCSCGYDSREQALRDAVFHLADVTRRSGEPVDMSRALFESAFGRNIEKHWPEFCQRCESNDKFQNRYRFALERGVGSSMAHNWALGCPNPELSASKDLDALWDAQQMEAFHV